MGPEANDHTWCLPRLLAAPGWGLRNMKPTIFEIAGFLFILATT